MNDHLIKNLKISILWHLIANIIFISLLLYVTTTYKSFEWYSSLVYLIFPVYFMLKKDKIILEVIKNENEITIKSYSILKGKKDLNLKIYEIIELDSYNGFVIKYKNSFEKKTETFQINAEPWNNIYGQIKDLKLAVQEFEKQSFENLNLSNL